MRTDEHMFMAESRSRAPYSFSLCYAVLCLHVHDQNEWTAEKIIGDGHCMFRSFERIRYGRARRLDQETIAVQELRQQTIRYIMAHLETYSPYLPIGPESPKYQSTEDYRRRMGGLEWGGHVELQVLCNLYGLTVHLIHKVSRMMTVFQPVGDVTRTGINVETYGKFGGVMVYQGNHYDLLGREESNDIVRLKFATDTLDALLMQQISEVMLSRHM